MSPSIKIEDNPCAFCGAPAKRFMFAAFVCESEECLDRAFTARGGPGGHIKNPEAWGLEPKTK